MDLINGPTDFAPTHVQAYHRHPEAALGPGTPQIDRDALDGDEATVPFEYPEPVQRRRGRPRKDHSAAADPTSIVAQYLSAKEVQDSQLAIQLRQQGKIVTPGGPFQESDAAEINGLMVAGVLKPELYSRAVHAGLRIFKSRMVREIKGKGTEAPYEKSRLVVQGYGDQEKKTLLTQSPTIQRSSQRLILGLAPTLILQGMTLELRDISQAYVQSKSSLAREFLVHLPKELRERYPEGTLLRVMKPLYGIAEAGLHWFATYQKHHREQLFMVPSAYDPCLMITAENKDFGLGGLQTDDTLLLATREFFELEEEELQRAGFRAKPRQQLRQGAGGDFNGCRLIFEACSRRIHLFDLPARGRLRFFGGCPGSRTN